MDEYTPDEIRMMKKTGKKRDNPEERFQREVMEIGKMRGWKRAHFRAARTKDGYRTPVQGDGKGFPDNVFLRNNRIVVAELKVKPNKPTNEQHKWLAAFAAAGAEVYVWYPEDIDKIILCLN